MSAFVHGDSMQLELLNEITLESIYAKEAEATGKQDELNILYEQKKRLTTRKNAATGIERKKLTSDIVELATEIEISENAARRLDDELYELLHEYGEQELTKAV